MRKATNYLNPGNFRPEQVRIGAGGLFNSIEEATTNGRIIAGNDTGPGPWVLDPGPTKWRPGMRAGLGYALTDILDQGSLSGCAGVSISPDGARAAIVSQMVVFTTTDLGSANPTWTKTSLACGWEPNGTWKQMQRKIQIDPSDPNVIYCVAQGNFTSAAGRVFTGLATAGLYRSLDFGLNWTRITTVPAPTGGFNFILALYFNGALSSARTGTIAVLSQGNGVYLSIDGGTTFALSASSPTDGRAIQYVADGKLLINSTNNATLSRLVTGTWTTTTINAYSMICHRTDATKVFTQFNGRLTPSADGGATFGTESGFPKRTANGIPWHAWTDEKNMGSGEAYWSLRYTGVVFPQGIGIWRNANTTTPFAGTDFSFVWSEMSTGIENMVTNQIKTVRSTGETLLTMHDRIGMQFRRADLTTRYASNHLNIKPWSISSPDGTTGTGATWGGVIVHGSNIEEAYDDPNWRAVQCNTRTYYTANAFATEPARTAADNGSYACNIMVRNRGEIVAVGQSLSRPAITFDYGATWNPCDFGTNANLYMANVTLNYAAYYLNRRIFARDDTNGDLYFYCPGGDIATNEYNHCAGVWRLPNNGTTTWLRQGTAPYLFSEGETQDGTTPLTRGQARDYDAFNGHLRAVPGKAGHLFWAAGDTGGPSHLWFSIDGGTTKQMVGSTGGHSLLTNPMLYPVDVAFGPTLPGRAYPVLIVACSTLRIAERAAIQGITPTQRQRFFIIQDFNPASPASATVEAITMDSNLIHPNGHWSDCLGVASWPDSPDFVAIFGNNGAICMRYMDEAQT